MLRALKQLAAFLHRYTLGWCTRTKPTKKRTRRQQRLHIESLEDRRVFAAGFAEFIDPNPAPGNQFGFSVVPLSTGNVVITSPFDDAGGTDAGAVYLFSGRTGKLISTLKGTHADDHVGLFGVTALTNGNFVVASPDWDSDTAQNTGAVTWGDGTVGVEGVVSASNSLVGVTPSDAIGGAYDPWNTSFQSGVVALPNGNYVVRSGAWHNGEAEGAGAVTFGNGQSGISGEVGEANSLVGIMPLDNVGGEGITVLTNGNYVVSSSNWNTADARYVGAVTWGSGTSGVSGAVSPANSLVGSHDSDQVGYDGGQGGIVALTNGNYVVTSTHWRNGSAEEAGAVTWVNGATGLTGEISAANSLVGTQQEDNVGGVAALTNGNYVVFSNGWRGSDFAKVGAITWANGSTGISGYIDETNSLVGSKAEDFFYSVITPLPNGNYVISSQFWDNGLAVDAGAVTFASGTSGLHGTISSATSLVGTTTDDRVGSDGVVPLTNGNYVVNSLRWTSVSQNGTVPYAGAVTWGSGTSGIHGEVSVDNSLVGSAEADGVGYGGIYALTNGNYVVSSPYWDNGGTEDAGAATWGSGTSGVTGFVSPSNSLVGSLAGDMVGGNVVPLANGNYVVATPTWQNGLVPNAGAATFANGTAGVVGVVSDANSLVGTNEFDTVGRDVTALANGNYVVTSIAWDTAKATNAGAVTFADGTTGLFSAVDDTNSLIGSTTDDFVGGVNLALPGQTVALPNGNYVVLSPAWHNGSLAEAGAATFGSRASGVTGPLTSKNSAIGQAENSGLYTIVLDNINKTFCSRFLTEGGGRVRVGSQIDGFSRPWHLAIQPQDVNNDGNIVADDVLTIINYINAGHSSDVAANATLGKPYGFLDVTGDGHVVAEDVLAVINYINASPSTEGEAASTSITPAASPPTTLPAASATPPTLTDSLLLLLAADNSSAKKRK